MSRVKRMRKMLRELERQAEAARVHERRMAEGLRESSSWSRQEDRDWIRWAAVDATVSREQAEASLVEGRALLARVELLTDLGLGSDRCCVTGEG
jgi:hypothetical protein